MGRARAGRPAAPGLRLRRLEGAAGVRPPPRQRPPAMILVDTSVVIDYLRTTDAKILALFQAHGAAVCGVTRAEVLHGARNPADRARLLTVLSAFQQVLIPDAAWDVVGDHLAALRSS